MNRFKILPCLLLTATLGAQEITDSFSPTDIPSSLPEGEVPAHFVVKARFDTTTPANFSTSGVKNQKMQYAEGVASIGYVFPATCCTQFQASVGYLNNYFGWDKNPCFNQSNFHSGNLSLGVRNTSYDSWEWLSEVTGQIDLEREGERSFLLFFSGYGKYTINSCLSTSLGFILRSGIHQEKVWPIIGLEFAWKSWKINTVFPLDLSVVYEVNDSWSFFTAAKIIDTRHRLGKQELTPNGILEYSNWGLEVGTAYSIDPVLYFNVHVGYLLGGDLQISNASDKKTKYFKIDASPYLGASLTFRF